MTEARELAKQQPAQRRLSALEGEAMCMLPMDGADLALEALVDALVDALQHVQPVLLWEPVHRWRAAEPGDAEACLGPASIWDVAAIEGRQDAQLDLFGMPEPEPVPMPAQPLKRQGPPTVEVVQRLKGRTVVSGLSYPSGRWTDARAEAERVRRMLQTPPQRPSTAGGFKFGKGA
jgi:hypothetical protein